MFTNEPVPNIVKFPDTYKLPPIVVSEDTDNAPVTEVATLIFIPAGEIDAVALPLTI